MGDCHVKNLGDAVQHWLSNCKGECRTVSADTPEDNQSPGRQSKVNCLTLRAKMQYNSVLLDRENFNFQLTSKKKKFRSLEKMSIFGQSWCGN